MPEICVTVLPFLVVLLKQFQHMDVLVVTGKLPVTTDVFIHPTSPIAVAIIPMPIGARSLFASPDRQMAYTDPPFECNRCAYRKRLGVRRARGTDAPDAVGRRHRLLALLLATVNRSAVATTSVALCGSHVAAQRLRWVRPPSMCRVG